MQSPVLQWTVTHIFIDSVVLLRESFKPYDVCGRSSHYDIEMIGAFRKVIDIVTQHVCFIEQYLDYMLRLTKSSTDMAYNHEAREYLGECGRGNIQPLKRPVDVGEHE